MPTYVMLANWTEQGMRAINDSPKRIDAAKKTLEEMGGQFRSVYMTMGDYDLVFVYEAPDDAVAARFTLVLGQLGTVRTRTLKAFPEAAYPVFRPPFMAQYRCSIDATDPTHPLSGFD